MVRLSGAEVADARPWPGPRPYRACDAQCFLGRDNERALLLDALARYPVVELTGEPGVGKTSLLQAGLGPDVECAGGVVLVCEWPTTDTGVGGSIYARALAAALGTREVELDALLARAGQLRRPVIVLDHLELLFDRAPQLGAELLQSIAMVARTHPQLRHVVSLRSAYRRHLRPLEAALGSHGFSWHELEPMTTDCLLHVIIEGARRADVDITDAAASELMHWWLEAEELRAARRTEPEESVDLTEPSWVLGSGCEALYGLQSVLWMLESGRRAAQSPTRVDVDELHAIGTAVTARVWSSDLAGPVWLHALFAFEGMSSFLDAVLSSADLPVTLRVARVTRHLTSGASRRAVPLDELAWLSLSDEMMTLGVFPREIGQAVTSAANGDEPLLNAESFADRPSDGHCAGRALGRPVAGVVDELVREFLVALELLRDSGLVREWVREGRPALVELAHDAYAPALELWSLTQLAHPMAVTTARTAVQGQDLCWPRLTVEEVGPQIEGPLWRGCRIAGGNGPMWVEGVEFANADLRGDWFAGCHFENVTFRECHIHNVDFDGCSFRNTRFEGGELESVVFSGCAVDDISFNDMNIDSLSLKSPRGRSWTVNRSQVHHFSVKKGRDLELRFDGSTLEQASIDEASRGAISFADCTLRFVAAHGHKPPQRVVLERCRLVHSDVDTGGAIT